MAKTNRGRDCKWHNPRQRYFPQLLINKMQVKLSETNLANLNLFIQKSKEVDPEYKVMPTAIVNMMFGEKVREVLARFKKNPEWIDSPYGMVGVFSKPLNVSVGPPKRLKEKKHA